LLKPCLPVQRHRTQNAAYSALMCSALSSSPCHSSVRFSMCLNRSMLRWATSLLHRCQRNCGRSGRRQKPAEGRPFARWHAGSAGGFGDESVTPQECEIRRSFAAAPGRRAGLWWSPVPMVVPHTLVVVLFRGVVRCKPLFSAARYSISNSRWTWGAIFSKSLSTIGVIVLYYHFRLA